MAAAVSKNSLPKPTDGIAGFQLVCDRPEGAQCAWGRHGITCLPPPPAAPKPSISVTQGLWAPQWRSLCPVMLFWMPWSRAPALLWVLWNGLLFIQRWFRELLCKWKHVDLGVGSMSSWWQNLGLILILSLEMDLIKGNGALIPAPGVQCLLSINQNLLVARGVGCWP